ncbi:MAG: STAS domain-containing protein, partial [Caldilineae bacterium]
PRLPAVPVSLAAATGAMYLLRPEGVSVVGEIPRGLPPVAPLWNHLSLRFIADLSTGSLAVGAISLVATSAIVRSLSVQTGQRVSSNQEFIGQGLANIACGFLSGYVSAGSFSRSVVNMRAGAQTPMSALVSGVFVLLAVPFLSPVLAYLPRTAIAGVLMVAAMGMINRAEITRIWRGARDDALIMAVTFLATLFLSLEFAVLTGIFLSFVVYVIKTSVPRVVNVLPDDNYRHLVPRPDKPPCPQLAIIDVFGDLYFGAVGHVERAIYQHMTRHPEQRYLLLRMRSVNQCDFSGIHALESIVHAYRERGGDVFLVRVAEPILALMKTTGFYHYLGADHFLPEDEAVTRIFYNILDPVVCIYECEVRAFLECQNLPKQIYPLEIPLPAEAPLNGARRVSPRELWEQLRSDRPPLVIDVREPREFRKGHIPEAQLHPLGKLLTGDRLDLPPDTPVVLVCRTNRRSLRAAHALRERGWQDIRVLEGGMQAWEAAGLLEAVEV